MRAIPVKTQFGVPTSHRVDVRVISECLIAGRSRSFPLRTIGETHSPDSYFQTTDRRPHSAETLFFILRRLHEKTAGARLGFRVYRIVVSGRVSVPGSIDQSDPKIGSHYWFFRLVSVPNQYVIASLNGNVCSRHSDHDGTGRWWSVLLGNTRDAQQQGCDERFHIKARNRDVGRAWRQNVSKPLAQQRYLCSICKCDPLRRLRVL